MGIAADVMYAYRIFDVAPARMTPNAKSFYIETLAGRALGPASFEVLVKKR